MNSNLSIIQNIYKFLQSYRTMAKKNVTKKTTKKVAKATNNSKKVTKNTKVTKKVVTKTSHKKYEGAKSKNKTTRIFSITIAAILLIIAAYLLITNGIGNNENNQTIEFNDSMLNMIVVEDPACSECQVEIVVDQMQKNVFDNLNPIRIDYNSKLGKQIIEETNSKFLPSYIFEEKITNDSKWLNLETAYKQVSYNNETYYMINHNLIPNKVLVNEVPELENSVVLGNPNAKVTVYEFSDFECQFCAIAQGNKDLVSQFQKSNPSYVPIVPSLFEDYVNNGSVKYVYYNYPLENAHVRAKGASIAALCANEQGKWKEFSYKLYNERDTWMKAAYVEQVYIEFARDLGMNIDTFGTCLSESSEKYSNQIDMEKEMANEIGVVAAPTFIIDRNFIVGAIDYDQVKVMIDSKLSE